MWDRERYPTRYKDCEIEVVTEALEGGWAVLAKVKHESAAAVQVTPLPQPEERFQTEEEARAFGYEQARAWIEGQAPAA